MQSSKIIRPCSTVLDTDTRHEPVTIAQSAGAEMNEHLTEILPLKMAKAFTTCRVHVCSLGELISFSCPLISIVMSSIPHGGNMGEALRCLHIQVEVLLALHPWLYFLKTQNACLVVVLECNNASFTPRQSRRSVSLRKSSNNRFV